MRWEGGTMGLGPGQLGIFFQPDGFPHLCCSPSSSVWLLELVCYTKPGSPCSFEWRVAWKDDFQPDLHRVSKFTSSKQRASLFNNSGNLGNREARRNPSVLELCVLVLSWAGLIFSHGRWGAGRNILLPCVLGFVQSCLKPQATDHELAWSKKQSCSIFLLPAEGTELGGRESCLWSQHWMSKPIMWNGPHP